MSQQKNGLQYLSCVYVKLAILFPNPYSIFFYFLVSWMVIISIEFILASNRCVKIPICFASSIPMNANGELCGHPLYLCHSYWHRTQQPNSVKYNNNQKKKSSNFYFTLLKVAEIRWPCSIHSIVHRQNMFIYGIFFCILLQLLSSSFDVTTLFFLVCLG